MSFTCSENLEFAFFEVAATNQLLVSRSTSKVYFSSVDKRFHEVEDSAFIALNVLADIIQPLNDDELFESLIFRCDGKESMIRFRYGGIRSSLHAMYNRSLKFLKKVYGMN